MSITLQVLLDDQGLERGVVIYDVKGHPKDVGFEIAHSSDNGQSFAVVGLVAPLGRLQSLCVKANRKHVEGSITWVKVTPTPT